MLLLFFSAKVTILAKVAKLAILAKVAKLAIIAILAISKKCYFTSTFFALPSAILRIFMPCVGAESGRP